MCVYEKSWENLKLHDVNIYDFIVTVISRWSYLSLGTTVSGNFSSFKARTTDAEAKLGHCLAHVGRAVQIFRWYCKTYSLFWIHFSVYDFQFYFDHKKYHWSYKFIKLWWKCILLDTVFKSLWRSNIKFLMVCLGGCICVGKKRRVQLLSRLIFPFGSY